MDGTTIYGVIAGSVGTGMSLFLLHRMITSERPNPFPHITEWEPIEEHEGHLIIKLRVVIQNRSKVANTVERILIKARDEKDFCFEPPKYDFLDDGKAYVNYQNCQLKEICKTEEVLPLPTNIESKQSRDGWLGFAISPEFVEKAKKEKWCIKVFDQSGKGFISTSDRDQVVSD